MLDCIVMCGLRRGNEDIPLNDALQIFGRVGRKYGSKGKAVVVCGSEEEDYAWKCLSGEAEPVVSEMSEVSNAAFYVLPRHETVYDDESFLRWYSRTLSCVQGKSMRWDDIRRFLVENGCMTEEWEITNLGRISSSMYVRPERAFKIKSRLEEAFSNGDYMDPRVVSWILCDDSSYQYRIPEEDSSMSEYSGFLFSSGYCFDGNEKYSGFSYFCAMNASECPRWMRQNVSSVKKSLDRDFAVLQAISKDVCTDCEIGMKNACCSFVNRIPGNLAELMLSLNLRSRSSVVELSGLGIQDKESAIGERDLIMEEGTSSLLLDLKSGGIIDFPEDVIREKKESEREFDF